MLLLGTAVTETIVGGLVFALELDAREHARAVDEVDHLIALRVGLEERLPIQDDARDVLAQAGSRVEQPMFILTVFLKAGYFLANFERPISAVSSRRLKVIKNPF